MKYELAIAALLGLAACDAPAKPQQSLQAAAGPSAEPQAAPKPKLPSEPLLERPVGEGGYRGKKGG